MKTERTRKRRKQYDKEELIAAVEDVRNNNISVSASARKHAVPRKTVADHVNYEILDYPLPGRGRMLMEHEETAVVEYIMYMSKRNMPLSRSDIRACVLVRV